MEKTQYAVLKKAKLFYGMEEEEISSMLACLSAREQAYKKGQYIYRIGDQITAVALVLNGCVHIQKEDYWGNLFLLSEIAPGELFGEVYAVFHDQLLTRNVIAAKDSTILFLDFRRILTACTAVCPFHTRLIQNFIMLLAERNQRLTQKLEHISQRTTREKLLSYLSEQSARHGEFFL